MRSWRQNGPACCYLSLTPRHPVELSSRPTQQRCSYLLRARKNQAREGAGRSAHVGYRRSPRQTRVGRLAGQLLHVVFLPQFHCCLHHRLHRPSELFLVQPRLSRLVSVRRSIDRFQGTQLEKSWVKPKVSAKVDPRRQIQMVAALLNAIERALKAEKDDIMLTQDYHEGLWNALTEWYEPRCFRDEAETTRY